MSTSQVNLFDSHCHISGKELGPTRAQVLERAQAAGVRALVDIATDLAQSAALVASLTATPPIGGVDVYAAVGLHPHESHHFTPAMIEQFRALAVQSPRVVAIGEMGLDYHYTKDAAVHALQAESFAAQMALAAELHKPFIVHSRDAVQDSLRLMRAEQARRGGAPLAGIMHCFTGDAAFAEACVALGLYVSFSGIVTYKNALEIQQAAKVVPLSRILVETDAPYLSPEPLRGNKYYPNEPARVVHTAKFVAGLRGESFAALAAATVANTRAVFGLGA